MDNRKGFCFPTRIEEFATFSEFSAAYEIGKEDLIFTSGHTWKDHIKDLHTGATGILRENYGKGEPTDEMVNRILADIRDISCQRIIAIGGGSVIDIAKALAVAAPGEDVDDLYEAKELKKRCELIIVPTTCGTGSEVTNISVINRIRKGVKMGLSSPAMYPDAAVLIPELLESLPYQVFATSSIDAMIHSVESFLSPNGCSISRLFSKEALRTIVSCWNQTVSGRDWEYYRSEFLRASNWAGIAFGFAGCAAVHALSYPLGAVHHIPHGQSNQLMFAEVMRKYKSLATEGRLLELEEVLAGCLRVAPEQSLEALCELMDQILKREPLAAFGVKEEELPEFAADVIKTQQRLLKNNLLPLSEEDILDIYRAAYEMLP